MEELIHHNLNFGEGADARDIGWPGSEVGHIVPHLLARINNERHVLTKCDDTFGFDITAVLALDVSPARDSPLMITKREVVAVGCLQA